MTVRGWLENFACNVRKDIFDGVRYTTQQFKKGAFRRLDWLSNRYEQGMTVEADLTKIADVIRHVRTAVML